MDPILDHFLRRQHLDGMALARASDVLDLLPLDGMPAQHYAAFFRCTGLVRTAAGEVTEADQFAVGIWFPDDYLRMANPFQVLRWMFPENVYHPNISDQAPFICVGRLAPGTPLVDILYQCFEIITYNKVTMREDDALNKDACVWARHHQHRLPLDSRPLKRRGLDLHVEPLGEPK